jgi:hypothetical protein
VSSARAALLLTGLVLALLGAGRVVVVSEDASPCPEGYLIVNTTGTFICPIPVKEYTSLYVSLFLHQDGSNFTVALACLAVSGCEVQMAVYDYYNDTLREVSRESFNLAQWKPGVSEEVFARSYTVTGLGVVELHVNNVTLGFFTAPELPRLDAVQSNLSEIYSASPLLAAIVGLLVVSIPLGWILQREMGLAGLALAGSSVLVSH